MPANYDDDRTFLEKYGLAVLAGIIVLIGAGVGLGFYFFSGHIPKPKPPEEIAVHPHAAAADAATPTAPASSQNSSSRRSKKWSSLSPRTKTPPKPENHTPSPPAAPGPKASGPPSDEGIGGGGGNGGDGIGGDGGGSVFGYYASQVGDQIRTVLSTNPKTCKASFKAHLHIWADSTGRITRVTLSHSADDPALDAAIQTDVLIGQMVPPPPQGMPMPILMSIDAKRPE